MVWPTCGATPWPRCCVALCCRPSSWASSPWSSSLLLSVPWVALGIAIGLGMAVVNLRFLDAGVAKLHTEGEPDNKVLRRAMGTKSITRLGIITVICIGLMLLEGGLGIGAVAGLVIFQLLFVLNVGRVVISQGVQ